LRHTAWNFTGGKKYTLYLHTQTYIYDHTQITLLVKYPVTIFYREIANVRTATLAYSVALLLPELTSA